MFQYHKQSKEYLNSKFKYVSADNDLNIDQSQDNIDRKLKESSHIFRNRRAGSLARLGHLLDVQKVTGSNPVRPTKNIFRAIITLRNNVCSYVVFFHLSRLTKPMMRYIRPNATRGRPISNGNSVRK